MNLMYKKPGTFRKRLALFLFCSIFLHTFAGFGINLQSAEAAASTTDPTVAQVDSVSVTGEGGVNAIYTAGGTLQMQAIVLPSRSGVNWFVYESDGVTATDKAVISSTGLLTAKKDGIVKVVAAAVDNTGAQGSEYIVISGQTPLRADLPSVTLNGPIAIPSGQSFSTNMGLANITASDYSAVYAIDATISFDASAIDFVSVESLKSAFAILQTNSDVPGQIRIIAASQGASGALAADGDLFKINWKVKNLVQPATVNINAASATVSNAIGQQMQAMLTSQTVTVGAANVDKNALQAVVNTAQASYDNAVEGTQSGQYPAGSKVSLLAAINEAKAVLDDDAASQQQADSAANTLNAALQSFIQSANNDYDPADVNRDGRVSIGDLAIVAVYYSKTAASADWDTAKMADVNHDGEVDIVDLAFVANRIVLFGNK